MFYRKQKHYHTHGFLFVLSLIAAFLLGRKSEQYGYSIISARGCGCSNEEDERGTMDENNASSSYSQ